jgi:hypothetical protein
MKFLCSHVWAKVISWNNPQEEVTCVNVLEVDVRVVPDEDILEEWYKFSLPNLPVQGEMCNFFKPFIKGIYDYFIRSRVLLVVKELNLQYLQNYVDFIVNFLLQTFEGTISFNITKNSLDWFVLNIEYPHLKKIE